MNYEKALQWYEKLMKDDKNDAEGGYDSVLSRLAPAHEVLANQAQIYLKGGYGITKDPNRSGNAFKRNLKHCLVLVLRQKRNKLSMWDFGVYCPCLYCFHRARNLDFAKALKPKVQNLVFAAC